MRVYYRYSQTPINLVAHTDGGEDLCGDALGQESDKGVGVSTNELVSLLTVLEEHEGGHGADAKLLADLGEIVDVDLGEEDVLELLIVGVLGEDRSNGLAGTAPGSEAVEHDDLVGLEGILPLLLAGNVVDNHFG